MTRQPTVIGEQFQRRVTLTADEITAFARQVGDENPLHHDADFAAGTRFGRIIASGPHITALFMAMVATYFSQKGPMLGLDFNMRFSAPAYADDTLTMTWHIVAVDYKPTLNGDLVTLEGTVINQDGQTLVIGEGHIVVTDGL